MMINGFIITGKLEHSNQYISIIKKREYNDRTVFQSSIRHILLWIRDSRFDSIKKLEIIKLILLLDNRFLTVKRKKETSFTGKSIIYIISAGIVLFFFFPENVEFLFCATVTWVFYFFRKYGNHHEEGNMEKARRPMPIHKIVKLRPHGPIQYKTRC